MSTNPPVPHVPTPASSDMVVAAPMSFAGSAQRIWKITRRPETSSAALVALSISAVVAVAFAWTVILAWYLFFGLLLVPYRLIRRGQRKANRDNLRHQEMLSAMAAQHAVAAQQLASQMQPLAVEVQATDIAALDKA
jgi:hypothetical protein